MVQPRSWSESLPCLCLYSRSKLCPSGHSLCCGGAQGHGLHGSRASVLGSRVLGAWMWGLGEQWHHQLLGSGLEGLCWGSAAGHPGWHGAKSFSCPSEGMVTKLGAGAWPRRGGESRASSWPSNPLIPFTPSPDPTDAQVWVQAEAQ